MERTSVNVEVSVSVYHESTACLSEIKSEISRKVEEELCGKALVQAGEDGSDEIGLIEGRFSHIAEIHFPQGLTKGDVPDFVESVVRKRCGIGAETGQKRSP